ncbi:MAG: hypothetical protein ACI83P_000403 [Janthinobacterium sp.]|jgi:hypothetical protein
MIALGFRGDGIGIAGRKKNVRAASMQGSIRIMGSAVGAAVMT